MLRLDGGILTFHGHGRTCLIQPAIAEAYNKMYSVTLAKDIDAVASFNFKKTLLRLGTPSAQTVSVRWLQLT